MRKVTIAQCRGQIAGGDAQGEALDDRGLADAGFAGEDRVVLPTPRQNVDDLPDLEITAGRDRSCRPRPAPSGLS